MLVTAGIRAGKGRTVTVSADEQNGYINAPLHGPPVWLDLKASGYALVPPELREKVLQMTRPAVRVTKAMYGLCRSVFDYEDNRDERLLECGAVPV